MNTTVFDYDLLQTFTADSSENIFGFDVPAIPFDIAVRAIIHARRLIVICFVQKIASDTVLSVSDLQRTGYSMNIKQ